MDETEAHQDQNLQYQQPIYKREAPSSDDHLTRKEPSAQQAVGAEWLHKAAKLAEPEANECTPIGVI